MPKCWTEKAFAENLYDLMACDGMLQHEFYDKHVADADLMELDYTTCIITCGEFKIEVSLIEK